MEYCSLHHYDVWQYDEHPSLSTDSPIDELCDFLYNRGGCVNHEQHLEPKDSTELQLTHGWLKCACWKAYDIARHTDEISVTQFTVTKQPTEDNPPVKSTIEYTPTQSKPTPTKNEVIETSQQAHPFRLRDVSPEEMEYKCGDVSALIKQSIWVTHGIDLPIISGAIADPRAEDGWPHAFLRITPTDVENLETTLFIDGTAKQFCDAMHHFPQTLGPEDELDGLQLITPDHELYKYYFENRNLVDTDFH